MIDEQVISLLSCPSCESDLQQENESLIKCLGCEESYEIDDGIIVLLRRVSPR